MEKYLSLPEHSWENLFASLALCVHTSDFKKKPIDFFICYILFLCFTKFYSIYLDLISPVFIDRIGFRLIYLFVDIMWYIFFDQM